MQILDFDDYLKTFEVPDIDYNDEITKIESVGYKDVCDIQVSGDNLFFANDILVHNCAVNKVDDVDNSAISDSLGTSMTADFMLFLLQNEGMKAKSEIVCKVTKNRFNGKTDSWMMGIDYPKMKFYDVVAKNDQTFTTPQQKQTAENFVKNEIKDLEHQSTQAIKILDNKQKSNSLDDFLKDLGV